MVVTASPRDCFKLLHLSHNTGLSIQTSIAAYLYLASLVTSGSMKLNAMDRVYDGHNPPLPKLGQKLGKMMPPRITPNHRESQFHL